VEDHPSVAAIRDGLDAFTTGDPDSLEEMLADDVVWHAPGHNRWSGTFSGKAATMDRMHAMAREGIVWNFDVHDLVGGDEHVVVLTIATVRKGNHSIHGQEVHVMHVRDGKMTEFWGYNEDQAAIDAVLNG
jgi:ketosteroid isomerase-like protein